VQAFLLPSLTAAAAAATWPAVRGGCVGVARGGRGRAAWGAGCWLLGPWASRVLFDAPTELPRLVAGLLGVSTVAMMVRGDFCSRRWSRWSQPGRDAAWGVLGAVRRVVVRAGGPAHRGGDRSVGGSDAGLAC